MECIAALKKKKKDAPFLDAFGIQGIGDLQCKKRLPAAVTTITSKEGKAGGSLRYTACGLRIR